MRRKRRTIRQRIKKRNINKNPKKLHRVLIILLILGSIYTLYFSTIFKVETISFPEEINTNLDLTDKVKSLLSDQIGENLLTIDTEEIENKIHQNFKELAELKISKNHPQTLEIEFELHPQIANVITKSSTLKKSYIINSIGYITKENFENPNLPYIHLSTDETINPEKQILNKEQLEYLLNSAQQFSDQFGMEIKEIIYKPIPREVHLLTARDFTIWLDAQQSYETQLKKLKKALPKLDIKTLELEYIDLRIAADNGDRIIYKLK